MITIIPWWVLFLTVIMLLLGLGMAREANDRGWSSTKTILFGPILIYLLVTFYFLREGLREVRDIVTNRTKE